MFAIVQKEYSSEIKNLLIDKMIQHSEKVMGKNLWQETPMAFQMFDDEKFIGGVAVDFLYQQMHIKLLFVEENYRSRGIGTALMQHVINYGKQKGATFAFLETLSYQAPDFYIKLGFEVELTRHGFGDGVSLLYLRKSLL